MNDDRAAKQRLDLHILGSSGLKQFDGVILEEFHRKLQGRFAVQVYREMADNSSAVGSIRYLIKALVRQVTFRVEPADESAEAAEAAAFVEGALDDMSHTFDDFLSEALSFLDYGWSYFEIVYKLRKGQTDDPTTRSQYDDGKIGWRKFALRAQDTLDRWELDPEDGGIRGMWQYDAYSGTRVATAFIPIEKALLFRLESMKNNPEGRSLYRNAVVDWFFLKRIQEIEAVGIERDMTGLLTMEVPLELLVAQPGTAEANVRSQLERMLSQLKRDEREYAMVPTETDRQNNPTGYKLKLLTTGGRRQIDTTEVKNYYRRSIFQTVLAQFLELGQQTGSWALASSMTNLFAVALGSVLDTVTATLNRFAIPRLLTLNGIVQKLWPTVVHGDLESPQLGEIGSYLVSLAQAGLLDPSKPLQRKLLEIANLPQPSDEHEEGVEKVLKAHPTARVRKAVSELRRAPPLRPMQLVLPMGGKR